MATFDQILGFGQPAGAVAPAVAMPGMPAPSFSQQMGYGYGQPMGNDIFKLGMTGQQPAAAPGASVDPAAVTPDSNWWSGQKGVSGDGVAGWLGNGQNLKALFTGISALTGAYLGFQQLRLAKENLSLQKDAYKSNLANSEQTYNTSLEDRIRGRTSNYEGKEEDVQGYLSANRLRQSKP